MTDDRLELTRRKILAGAGAMGLAGAGAGFGTSAYFSDQETFTNNQLVAGELDMKVSATHHYVDWLPDTEGGPNGLQETDDARMPESDADVDLLLPALSADSKARPIELDIGDAVGLAEGSVVNTANSGVPVGGSQDSLCTTGNDADEATVIDLEDVKPGDFGAARFEFALCDNPGYVWLNGNLVDASENTVTEPEAEDDDEKQGVVELLDEVQVAVLEADVANTLVEAENGNISPQDIIDALKLVGSGSLREFLAAETVPLAGDTPAEDGGGTGRNCYSAVNNHYVSVIWWLPIDHGNQVQTDSVTFDLGFYTEQCRHNDGVGLSTDLVGYYPLDTVWDGTAEDLSGLGNDGTVEGDVSSVSGQIANAFSFNGVDEYVTVPDDPSLDIQDEITISFWFRLTGQSSDNRYPRAVSKGQSTTSNGAYGIFIEDAGGDPTRIGLRFIDTDDNKHDVDTGNSLPNYNDGNWHHVAAVYSNEADIGRLWFDGTEHVDRTISGDVRIRTTTDALHLGDGNGERHLNGDLDGVRIYDRALSDGEIQSLADQ